VSKEGEDALNRYFAHAAKEVIPAMKDSRVLSSKPDPKLCMELGACILLEKPLVLMVPRGQWIPPRGSAPWRMKLSKWMMPRPKPLA